ncbi:inositol monophosphatase [Pseudovirgaria hyperparasitica]|uniref:Inositol-1-monophosphatase n=1 Tax=Pseudovirgaria hyperparasitica TaxID=470096 RepID=A0A6A6WGV7_9PEZI|nr:inositol monophosphatase [Pseudovirgaria hyperparasitica]KAF2761314.1 inositol monophosphatase [Pseudovirgaria hyperparasitica]
MADAIDYQAVHDLLVSVAHRAGDMMTAATPVSGSTGIKKNSADLVTETDQAVEKMVSTTLKQHYPDFAFMGEETYQPGDKLTPAPTFICDPIDGTTNFVHRFHDVCISLGLAVARTPIVGVVYNPFTRTLWSAVQGQGAYKYTDSTAATHSTSAAARAQKLPLHDPAPMPDLSTCLVAVEWGSERTGNDFAVRSRTFARLCASKEAGGAMVHGLRSFGSAALNLCEVASGTLDAYWEAGCWAWDVCAGVAILREAGGVFVDGNAGGWEVGIDERRHLAVRAGEGQKGVVEEFWSMIEGRFEVGA